MESLNPLERRETSPHTSLSHKVGMLGKEAAAKLARENLTREGSLRAMFECNVFCFWQVWSCSPNCLLFVCNLSPEKQSNPPGMYMFRKPPTADPQDLKCYAGDRQL